MHFQSFFARFDGSSKPSARFRASVPEAPWAVSADVSFANFLLARFRACSRARPCSCLRRRMNIELNFLPKLRGARSRLYRRRCLQVNTRWNALAEIYTMHSFAPFFNLKISAKNHQHFFANEKNIFRFFFICCVEFCIFLRIVDENLSGLRDKFQKRVTCVAFSKKFAQTN